MIIVCAIHVIFSLFFKVLIDSSIDDFLRKNGHKSLAKKRKLREKLTHNDIREIVPKSYVICNFIIYCILLFVIILTIVSLFVSDKVNLFLKNIGCLIIIVECSCTAISRFYEVLWDKDKKSKLWNKILLVVTIIAVLFFFFID